LESYPTKYSTETIHLERKILFRVGRLVFIKYALRNFPHYHLSLPKMPKAVANKIIQIQCRLLWVGYKEGPFSSVAKSKAVHLPKSFGGLANGDILMKNACVLLKCVRGCL